MSKETNQTEKILKCNKCQEWKSCSAFSKDKNRKNGYQYQCKECTKKYKKEYRRKNAEYLKQRGKEFYWNNTEYFKQRSKKYYQENAESIKQQHKKYYQENSESIKQQVKEYSGENAESKKQYRNTLFKADNTSKHLEEIKTYEPYMIDSDNDINFQCTYCGEYFKTTKMQIWQRLNAVNSEVNGTENRLYCSEQCKYECPVYKRKLYSKDQVHGTSREVQPELRQMVLARDNYTCQKCNKHKDNLEVGLHCHHIWPTNEDPITSADMDTCITYCKDCHKWVHMNVPGCGYAELRCSLKDYMLV